MPHGRLALAASFLATVAIGGCGSSSNRPEPAIEGSPKEQIATTVNAMFDAWKAGDGAGACSLLTEHGRKGLTRLAGRFAGFEGDVVADNCERAVEESAPDFAQEPPGLPFSEADVSRTGNDAAQVNCEFGTAVLLRRVNGAWLVATPFCVN